MREAFLTFAIAIGAWMIALWFIIHAIDASPISSYLDHFSLALSAASR